jgi:hypothetical protein
VQSDLFEKLSGASISHGHRRGPAQTLAHEGPRGRIL